jgi:hypothetical protein
MAKAIEVWEDEGGARGWVASKAAQSARLHRTSWTGVLYAIAIVVVFAVVARLY